MKRLVFDFEGDRGFPLYERNKCHQLFVVIAEPMPRLCRRRSGALEIISAADDIASRGSRVRVTEREQVMSCLPLALSLATGLSNP